MHVAKKCKTVRITQGKGKGLTVTSLINSLLLHPKTRKCTKWFAYEPILSQMNSVQMFGPYIPKINYNITPYTYTHADAS